jgi:hypothetical protein
MMAIRIGLLVAGAAVLVGVWGACGGDGPEKAAKGQPSPFTGQRSDPAEQIIQAQASLRETPRDIELDAFIEGLDLKASFGERSEEIIEQWRKTRIEAARGLERTHAQVKSPGLAAPSLQYTPDPSFMEGLFGGFFASWLDEFTAKGASEQKQQTRGGTEEGPTTSTTSTLDETMELSANGSRVTAVLHWIYHTKTVDKATGATLLEAAEDRKMTGVIDVCPSGAGLVPASLDSAIKHVAVKSSGTSTTLILTTNSTFSGQVSDQAILVGVDQETKTSITGPFGSATGTLSVAGRRSSATTDGDAGGRGLAVLELGQAGAYMYNAQGSDPYEEAQTLWRHGRCVMVRAYGVETPVRVAEQDIAMHKENAPAGRDEEFEVTLRHRFGGDTLSQPVEAMIATGAGELDPERIDPAPGEVTYTAVQEGETRVRLQSTSKRGIGTLVLRFETKPAMWKGTVTYTYIFSGRADYGGGYGSSSTETIDATVRVAEGEPGSWSGQYTGNGQETRCVYSVNDVGQGSATGNAWLKVTDFDARIYGETFEDRQTEDDATVNVEIQDGAYRIDLSGSIEYEKETTYSYPGGCGPPPGPSHTTTSEGRHSISASGKGRVDPEDPDTFTGSETQETQYGFGRATATLSWNLTRS